MSDFDPKNTFNPYLSFPTVDRQPSRVQPTPSSSTYLGTVQDPTPLPSNSRASRLEVAATSVYPTQGVLPHALSNQTSSAPPFPSNGPHFSDPGQQFTLFNPAQDFLLRSPATLLSSWIPSASPGLVASDSRQRLAVIFYKKRWEIVNPGVEFPEDLRKTELLPGVLEGLKNVMGAGMAKLFTVNYRGYLSTLTSSFVPAIWSKGVNNPVKLSWEIILGIELAAYATFNDPSLSFVLTSSGMVARAFDTISAEVILRDGFIQLSPDILVEDLSTIQPQRTGLVTHTVPTGMFYDYLRRVMEDHQLEILNRLIDC